jgi:hypothetical protein
MFFKEETSSKNPIAENIVFLPNSFADEVEVMTESEDMLSLEQAIDQIGVLPTIVQIEYIHKGINLDQRDLKLLSNFLLQYQDISKWLRVLAFPKDKAEIQAKAELKKSESNLVKPFADYYWMMLEVLKMCLKKRQIGKNSPPNLPYSLWFDMIRNNFVESLENSGFLKPFSNNYPKSKREITDRWRDYINARLKIINERSMEDCSMFSPIGDNWELFEQKGHKIFFEDSLRWAKKNGKNDLVNRVGNLFKQERKLLHTISKGDNCGMYQFLTIHDEGINVTGRKATRRI